MSHYTEIYLCKSGQSVRQGRMEISSSIDTREKARIDAIARCKKDWALFKVVYYAVDEDEDKSRLLFTHDNPDAVDGSEKPKMWQMEKPKETVKPSFLARLISDIF